MAGGRDKPVNLVSAEGQGARAGRGAAETTRRREVLTRAEAFTRQLQAELAEAARCHAVAAGIIGELTAGDCCPPAAQVIGIARLAGTG